MAKKKNSELKFYEHIKFGLQFDRAMVEENIEYNKEQIQYYQELVQDKGVTKNGGNYLTSMLEYYEENLEINEQNLVDVKQEIQEIKEIIKNLEEEK